MTMRRVVVTGMGCVCAAGNDAPTVWRSLCTGVQHRVPAQHLHPDALPYPYFTVDDACYATGPHGGRIHTAQDTLQLARCAAREALTQAQLPPDAYTRMGVIIGTTAGSALHFLEGYAAARQHMPAALSSDNPAHAAAASASAASAAPSSDGTGRAAAAAASPATLPQDIRDYFASNLALTLAQEWQSTGISLTIANACTSGTDAVGLAAACIAQGVCDVVLCGGADALSLVPHTGFARLMIYSADAPRPFDAQRQGLNLGEGAGMLVLESAAHAAARTAPLLGRVVGYGAAADAHHFTAPHPDARGLAQAVRTALAAANDGAGIAPDALACINAHGTATLENDAIEGRFFARALPRVPVWGSKSITGHTLGAAGALEAIFCLMALAHGHIPPTWGFHTPQDDIGLTPTRSLTPCVGQYALSTSLAFGGGNAALLLAKAAA